MAGAFAVRLLGPVELWRDGAAIPAGGPTQRAVLAMLALRAGEPVAVESLSDGIWGEAEEPAGALKAMQVHIARLRRVVAHDSTQPIETVSGGYRLDPDDLTVDAPVFERELSAGRQQLADGDARAAADTLAAALALWRGPALMDLRDFPFAPHVAVRYDELRTDAAEEAVAARLALGESRALVPELQELIAANPYRERLHAQLMTALYRAGQQAAALDAYTAARSRLVLDLGVEPGPELQRLQQQILAQDPALATGAPMAVASRFGIAARARPAPRLPPAPALFGREALLAELEDLAKRERLITLTGAGGSGKTSLALVLAHRLAPRYRDGAVFVDLAAVARPEEVLSAAAAGIGLASQSGNLADELAAIAGERRMLIVLDNLEHILGAVPRLAGLIEATRGLIVATSRMPLGLRAEVRVVVPPLSVPDAEQTNLDAEPTIRLFLRAANNAGAMIKHDELAGVASICRALDGLPLAIELVAAQTAVEAVGELETRLAERLPRLAARSGDAPERQRTMQAAIAWSLDRLSPAQRRAFEQLSIFAGSFSVRGAAAVLQIDRAEAIRLLGALLEVSLLTREPSVGRHAQFRMLEPLRAVARTRTLGREWEGIVSRHAAFIVGEVERLCPRATGPRSVADVAELRHQHPDVVAALRAMVTTSPDACVDVLINIQNYAIWASQAIDSARFADELLASGGLSDRAACWARLLLTERAYHSGDLSVAFDALDRALDLAERSSDAFLQASAHSWEAILAADAGDERRAKSAARRAQMAARRSDDLVQRVEGAFWEHEVPGAQGSAGEHVEALLAQAEARNAVLARAYALEVLRHLSTHGYAGQLDQVRLHKAFRAALDAVRQIAGPIWVFRWENNYGNELVRSGAVDEGRALLLSALKMTESIGWRQETIYPLGGLGQVQAAIGQWHNALVLDSAARAVARELGFVTLANERDSADLAAIEAAEKNLGPDATAEARAIGERMTYREAVDFAFEVNGVPRSEEPAGMAGWPR